MEYYEESFLKFEETLDLSLLKDESRFANPYAKSEFALQKFKKYEKDMIKGSRKKFRSYCPKINLTQVPKDKVLVEEGDENRHSEMSTSSVLHIDDDQV